MIWRILSEIKGDYLSEVLLSKHKQNKSPLGSSSFSACWSYLSMLGPGGEAEKERTNSEPVFLLCLEL